MTALPPVPPHTPVGLPHATGYRVPALMLSPATGATRAAIVSRETGWSSPQRTPARPSGESHIVRELGACTLLTDAVTTRGVLLRGAFPTDTAINTTR